MRVGTRVGFALGVGIAVLAAGQSVTAGQKSRSDAYIAMVADVHRDAPDDMGLLPAAAAEAKIASTYAKLAAKATDLGVIKLNTGYVINAVDPRLMAEGPGLGFGVKRAASDAAETIEAAAKVQGASQNIATHAAPVAAACRATVARADKVVALAKQVLASTSVPDASKLVTQLNTLVDQLMTGIEGDPGLKQAGEHLAMLKKGEGLP